MGRRAWAWGAGLFVIGVVVVVAGAHAMATYQPADGSAQTTTLGQVAGVLLGGGVTIAGGLVLGTGIRRRLAVRRRRRLHARLERDT